MTQFGNGPIAPPVGGGRLCLCCIRKPLESFGGSMRGNSVRARWVTAAAGAASLVLVLSACGGTTEPSTTPADGGGGGTIIAYGSEPQNPLLPANTNETGGGRIMKLLFEGLISYDAEGKPVNQVAESIDSTDGQNYTIKLAPGWKFTNGEAVDGTWVHNVNIKVKKNPDYKGTMVAKNAGVDVKVYTDPGAGYVDLLANNLDVIDTIPDNNCLL